MGNINFFFPSLLEVVFILFYGMRWWWWSILYVHFGLGSRRNRLFYPPFVY